MSDSSRRILGFVFGTAMGLAYAVSSQYINVLFLPGLPIFQPPPGRILTILLTALLGGLLGLLAAWTIEALPGMITSALAGAIITTIITLQSATETPEQVAGAVTILVITFFPRAIVFAPVAGLVRWVTNLWEHEILKVNFSIRKMALSLAAIVLLATIFGVFSLYPKEARYAMQTTQDLVQAGMQATSQDNLPKLLLPVDGFLQGAHGAYTLRLSDNPDILPVQRRIVAYNVTEYAVFVNFANGFKFGCAYSPPYPDPSCGEY
jgi:hypothetical protein